MDQETSNLDTSISGQIPPAAASLRPAPLGPPTSDAMSILLVDDDDSVRVSVADLLENLGYKVHDVSSVASAMDRIQREKIDLVITDLCLKKSSGVELIAQVRKQTSIPVLLISGGTYTKINAELQDSPKPDAILIKPLRLDEILHAIQSCAKPTDFKLTNGH